MSSKIGIISDIHASPVPLLQALEIFRKQAVDKLICAGDIAGYGNELEKVIAILTENNFITVQGNHDQWYLEESEHISFDKAAQYFNQLGNYEQITVQGKRIYIVHAHPPDAIMGGMHLLDKTGMLIEQELKDWEEIVSETGCDVLIVGHTHQVFSEYIGNTLVINPGSCKFNHSCAVLELPEMNVYWYALSGKQIEKTWNWSDQIKK